MFAKLFELRRDVHAPSPEIARWISSFDIDWDSATDEEIADMLNAQEISGSGSETPVLLFSKLSQRSQARVANWVNLPGLIQAIRDGDKGSVRAWLMLMRSSGLVTQTEAEALMFSLNDSGARMSEAVFLFGRIVDRWEVAAVRPRKQDYIDSLVKAVKQ